MITPFTHSEVYAEVSPHFDTTKIFYRNKVTIFRQVNTAAGEVSFRVQYPQGDGGYGLMPFTSLERAIDYAVTVQDAPR